MIITGDCLSVLPTLPTGSIQCVVTSPPCYGLRDYGVAGQIGLESTPEAYVEKMVAVFREVKRVLRDDGTVWMNLGIATFIHNRAEIEMGKGGRLYAAKCTEVRIATVMGIDIKV